MSLIKRCNKCAYHICGNIAAISMIINKVDHYLTKIEIHNWKFWKYTNWKLTADYRFLDPKKWILRKRKNHKICHKYKTTKQKQLFWFSFSVSVPFLGCIVLNRSWINFKKRHNMKSAMDWPSYIVLFIVVWLYHFGSFKRICTKNRDASLIMIYFIAVRHDHSVNNKNVIINTF